MSFSFFMPVGFADILVVVVEMGLESPCGVPEQVAFGDHGETGEDAGSETRIEGEDVEVVCGAPALPISEFELQAFIFSKIVRKKELEGQILSEGVFDIARPPQCEFSNLQILLITSLLEFLCWPVLEFY